MLPQLVPVTLDQMTAVLLGAAATTRLALELVLFIVLPVAGFAAIVRRNNRGYRELQEAQAVRKEDAPGEAPAVGTPKPTEETGSS